VLTKVVTKQTTVTPNITGLPVIKPTTSKIPPTVRDPHAAIYIGCVGEDIIQLIPSTV